MNKEKEIYEILRREFLWANEEYLRKIAKEINDLYQPITLKVGWGKDRQ